MAYQLKTTGIAANCTMCIAVDPDTDEIKDFSSSAVTSTITVGAGISIGSQDWDGNTRKFIQLAASNEVAFGANKPRYENFNSAGLERSVVWIGESADATAARVFGSDSQHYVAAVNLAAGGATHPAVNGLGFTTLQNGGFTAPSVGQKVIWGFSAKHGTGNTFYTALHNASAMSKAAVGTPTSSASSGFDIAFLSRRNDNVLKANDKIHVIAIFDIELTESDWDALRDDWFTVLLEPAGPTPVAFTGTVPTLNGTEGVAFSESLASYFSGTETPFAFTVQSGTLPAGLTLNSSTGLISGTPTTAGDATGIVIRATDDATDTADSNSFTISIAAAPAAIAFTGTVPTQNLTVDEAMTPLDLSTYFGGEATPFAYAVQTGTLQTGLSINTSTGVISGTPTEVATRSIVVRGTDDNAETADTNSFDIVVAAAPSTDGTLTFTTPLKNNTGTVQANLTGLTATIIDMATRDSVESLTGQTTNSSGIPEPITNPAVVIDDTYRVVYMSADGTQVGISGIITAT